MILEQSKIDMFGSNHEGKVEFWPSGSLYRYYLTTRRKHANETADGENIP